ncbi:hypothetical protein A4D02_16035 [Niastella koreensis]|nr:hypothetical protein A4D02_16035 [Niastella koreensis]
MTRPIFVLALLISLISSCANAQQKKSEVAAIEDIRTAFKDINSNNTYKVEKYTYEAAGCADDGRLEYYLDKQQIVKIKESGSSNDVSSTTEYYYRDGRVFFIYQLIAGGVANGELQKTEFRIYVKDGKAIRFMQGQEIIPVYSKTTNMMETAVKLLKARTTKNFKEVLCDN